MKMIKESKNYILLLTIFMFLFLLNPICYGAMTLTLGDIVPTDTSQHRALVKFIEIIEERTNGEIKINFYPSAQLGTAPDQVDSVAMGAQDLFAGGLTWWTQYSPRVRLVEVPFIWESRDHFENWVENVLATTVQETLIQSANQRFINLEVLWRRGPYRAIMATRPIMKIEDLRGLKLRIWEADLPQRVWRMMGTVPITLPWGEAYLAIRQGVVEAVTSPMDSIWGFKFTEVAPFVTELQQFPQIMGISINENTWQRLTDEQKAIFVEAANEAGDWYNEQLRTQIAIEKQFMMVEHNAVFIQLNNKPFMEKASREIFPKLIEDGQIDAELYEEIRKYVP